MKKMFTLLIIAALAFSLVACGGSQTETTIPTEKATLADTATIRANFEKAEAFADALFDGLNMSSSIQDDGEGSGIYKSWFYQGEPDKAAISSEIEIDGNKIIINKTTAKDVESFGLSVDKSNETAQKDAVETLTLNKGDRICTIMLAPNETDKEQPIDDFPVFEVMTMTKDYAIPFTYCGLCAGATMEDVLKALGTPNYRVTLSAEDTSTSFEVNYNNVKQNGNKEISDTVTLQLIYDANSNTATLDSIDLRHEEYTYTEES